MVQQWHLPGEGWSPQIGLFAKIYGTACSYSFRIGCLNIQGCGKPCKPTKAEPRWNPEKWTIPLFIISSQCEESSANRPSRNWGSLLPIVDPLRAPVELGPEVQVGDWGAGTHFPIHQLGIGAEVHRRRHPKSLPGMVAASF